MEHKLKALVHDPTSHRDIGYCECGNIWPCQDRHQGKGPSVLSCEFMLEDELIRAEAKHPDWPKDPVDQAAIMMEEAGESIQAALDWKYEEGDPQLFINEVVQTGAMCLRILKNIDREWKPVDHQFRDNMIINILKDVMRGLEGHGETSRVTAVQRVIHEMGG